MDVTTEIPATCNSYRDFRFPEMFAAAAIGIGICHFDGRILEANPALGRMLGYDREERAGLDPWKFHDSEFQGAAQANGSVLLRWSGLGPSRAPMKFNCATCPRIFLAHPPAWWSAARMGSYRWRSGRS